MWYGSCSSKKRDLEAASRELTKYVKNKSDDFWDETLDCMSTDDTRTYQLTVNQKFEIVIKSLKEEVSARDLCSKFKISEDELAHWKLKFIEGGLRALQDSSLK